MTSFFMVVKGSRDAVGGNEASKGDGSVQNELKYFFIAHMKFNGSDVSQSNTVTFNPPCLISTTAEFPGTCMNIFGTPVSSTTSKIVLQYAVSKKASLLVRFLRTFVFRPWLFHLFEANVFDGDTVFLNGQARKLRQLEQEGKGWDSQYFVPISCDAAVVGFRRYVLKERCG